MFFFAHSFWSSLKHSSGSLQIDRETDRQQKQHHQQPQEQQQNLTTKHNRRKIQNEAVWELSRMQLRTPLQLLGECQTVKALQVTASVSQTPCFSFFPLLPLWPLKITAVIITVIRIAKSFTNQASIQCAESNYTSYKWLMIFCADGDQAASLQSSKSNKCNNSTHS